MPPRPAFLTFAAFITITLIFSVYRPSWPAADINALDPLPDGQSRRAYATFYSTHMVSDDLPDPYFTATRVLAWQLLHRPETRMKHTLPFLVLVPPHVSAGRRAILEKDGAIVVPVANLTPSNNWATPGQERWADQFTKLRLFEQTRWDRILYIDNDMLLTKPLDDIWDEPAAMHVMKTKERPVGVAEAPLEPPANYLLSGVTDNGGWEHPVPPSGEGMLNGGFLMLRPDKELFNYYVDKLNTPGSFDSGMMEQSLLNSVHDRAGRMPWQGFPPGKWNANFPMLKDVANGAATLHDKFWDAGNKGDIDRELVEMWFRIQGQMEGFWIAKGRGEAVVKAA
ncbi:nucleotide-diphospho-sugar transferase [Trichodelitschia bisporula]|uniref:Nucleotide-diphospho-sugar transferase n=1 Tax=Trichodelitschia bisporula TaxID=703511 RepID=A0A6G1HKR7_9PEZI|nr:nucleotide-diphospho-sugar transferase [Trichodelitschia bisporula]